MNIHMIFNKTYLIQSIFIYACMVLLSFSFVLLPGSMLPFDDVIKNYLYIRMAKYGIYIILFYWLQVSIDMPMLSRRFLVIYLIGSLWYLLIPLLTYTSITVFTADIAFAASLIILLIAILSIIDKYKISGIIIFLFFSIIFTLPPIFNLIHFAIYGFPINDASLIGILQTNIEETKEYILVNVGMIALGIIAISTFLLYFAIYYEVNMQLKQMEGEYVNKRSLIVLLMITVMSFVYLMPRTYLVSHYIDVHNYQLKEAEFLDKHTNNVNTIVLYDEIAKNKPHSIIVVIGESASRDFMRAYTQDYKFDDTPWLSSKKNNDNFILLKNAYSSYNQTVIAVPRALTNMSQYNNVEFDNAISIIDIARKAGFKTYWFTNQGDLGKYSAAITMLANTADVALKAKDDEGKPARYDEEVLSLLKMVNKEENNLIIVHIYGSHAKYASRYPDKYNKFSSDDIEGTYANSILYTDDILKSIFEYGENNLNLESMIYFSDHGEDMKWQHHPSKRLWNNYHIPMMIYLSNNYIQKYPGRVEILRKHQDECFSNDMVYNTIAGIMGAKSNYYDAKEDISSSNYAFDRNNVMIMLGKIPVNLDDGNAEF